MSSSERVNVLLSRARDGLIMIGSASTFQGAKGGNWSQLLAMLREQGNVYNGLPVKCERHPTREAILECPDDFDQHCPDGGCTQPWYDDYHSSDDCLLLITVLTLQRDNAHLRGTYMCQEMPSKC